RLHTQRDSTLHSVLHNTTIYMYNSAAHRAAVIVELAFSLLFQRGASADELAVGFCDAH
ncbi:hypothetical protein BaRGS_00002653, partial [Batillaria attramentaria]